MLDEQQTRQAGQRSQQAEKPKALSSPSSTSAASVHYPDYSYYQKVFAGRPIPFAYLDLDLLQQNIDRVAANAGGKYIRLASKSLRSVAVIRRILDAQACFRGLMCFNAREAVYLASQGFDDLLLGYPMWQQQDIAAVAQASANGASITLMVDSVEHVERIEAIARQHGVRLPLCLEMDMALDLPGFHFGALRSPIHTAEQGRPVIERIIKSQHVWLDGLMGYEGQIAGVGDRLPGQGPKNMLVRLLKRRSVHDLAERRAALASLVASYGIQLRFINGGGTGSLHTTRAEAAITEITVGSAFYAPALFDYYHDFRYQPAAGYAIEIVRHPKPSIYTCLGGGYIASGAIGNEKQPAPYLPRGARLDPLEGAGEVQTPIRYKGAVPLRLGDPIFMRHSKAGELCERFTHLLLVSHGEFQNEVTTYRGDGQCFI